MAGEIEIASRWIHFVAGIIWIGLLYFFNFVNVPFQKELPGDIKPKVNPKLLGRALAWFRHAAWVTVAIGLVLIHRLYWQFGDYTDSLGARTILAGGVLGIIMMLNVWGVIWPNQRKLLKAMADGTPTQPQWAKNALLASRINVVLSFPMLLFMAASTHYPLDWDQIAVAFVFLGAVAGILLWMVQGRPAGAAQAKAPATASR